MHLSAHTSGYLDIHFDKLFLQLALLSFSHILWLLPEFLVINKVVPVTQKECQVFWGPPFVYPAPNYGFSFCLSPLSWGLGHLSLGQLPTSFLSFGAGVTSSIWIRIFSSHSSPPLPECLVQKKLLLLSCPEEKGVPCMHITSKKKKSFLSCFLSLYYDSEEASFPGLQISSPSLSDLEG